MSRALAGLLLACSLLAPFPVAASLIPPTPPPAVSGDPLPPPHEPLLPPLLVGLATIGAVAGAAGWSRVTRLR